MTLSVLIPAHNEAEYLPACLDHLLASDPVEGDVEVIVVANGCTDGTEAVAEGYAARMDARGWRFAVLSLASGGKLGAWNAGEAEARGEVLVYLDADVTVSPPLLGQLAVALKSDAPRYASGTPNVTVPGGDLLTRLYTRFWLTIPFITVGVPGFGLFAMNRTGRARWGEWPDIISDDTFARLQFASHERQMVAAQYDWPMITGFAPLVRVRRRQEAGVAEIAARFPELIQNEETGQGATPLWQRALRDPSAFAAYCAVRLAVRLPILRSSNRWVRGR